MFIFLDEQTPIPYITAGLLLTGFGISFFSSPNSNIILGALSNNDYGVGSSMISAARTFGQVIGMALLTIIAYTIIGNTPVATVAPALIVRYMHFAYMIFTGICIAGVFISFRRREKR
jgi:hypothetical protein